MKETEWVDAVRSLVISIVNSQTHTRPDAWLMGQWVGAEASDANLSTVVFPTGATIRGIPKNANLGSINPGDLVLMANPRGGTLVIVCKIVGNPAAFVL